MSVRKKISKKKVVKKARKVVKKAVKKPVEKEVKKKLVGEVSHFYGKISVGVVDLSDTLSLGDKISIEGASTNFTQKVESMQIEYKQVKQASKGDSIGLKVKKPVREGDKVYRVV